MTTAPWSARPVRLLRLPIAVVSVAEDKRLGRQDMPSDWTFASAEDDRDREIWARYTNPTADLPVARFRRMGGDGEVIGDPPPGFGS